MDLRFIPVAINIDTEKAIKVSKSEPLQLTAIVEAPTYLVNTGRSSAQKFYKFDIRQSIQDYF